MSSIKIAELNNDASMTEVKESEMENVVGGFVNITVSDIGNVQFALNLSNIVQIGDAQALVDQFAGQFM